MDYYLLINNQQTGPYALGQLRSMWAGGVVTLDTLYWVEGMPEWLRLRTISGELERVAPVKTAAANIAKDRKAGNGAKIGIILAIVLLVALGAGAGVFFALVKTGERGGWSKAADTELRRCLRDFVGAGVQLDSMARQDTSSLAFGRQLEVAILAFEFPSQAWPSHFAPHAREEFEAAVDGWKLLLQIRQLRVGESYALTNNARLVSAMEAYAPGRVEYAPDPALKGFVPFEPNIRTLLTVASGHFAAGCGHLENFYAK